jgi:hypothetical protein
MAESRVYWCFTREERTLTRFFVFRNSEKGSGPEVPRDYRYKGALEEEVWITATVGTHSVTLPRPIHLHGRDVETVKGAGKAKAAARSKASGEGQLYLLRSTQHR